MQFGLDVFGAVALRCAPLREARKLVVSFEDEGLRSMLAALGPATAAFRLDPQDWLAKKGTGSAPALPCADSTFDIAVLCRGARHSASLDIQSLLAELHRVIRPAGSLVLLDLRRDFSFAPLPAGAEIHLLKRWLLTAGFDTPQFESAASDWLVTSAARRQLARSA